MLHFLAELITVPVAQAQAFALTPPANCNFAYGDIHFDCIPSYISMLTSVVIGFTASLCLVRIMWCGFTYMLGPATGDSSDAAKKGIINALLGLAVCLLVYIIIDTIVVYVTS